MTLPPRSVPTPETTQALAWMRTWPETALRPRDHDATRVLGEVTVALAELVLTARATTVALTPSPAPDALRPYPVALPEELTVLGEVLDHLVPWTRYSWSHHGQVDHVAAAVGPGADRERARTVIAASAGRVLDALADLAQARRRVPPWRLRTRVGLAYLGEVTRLATLGELRRWDQDPGPHLHAAPGAEWTRKGAGWLPDRQGTGPSEKS